MGLVIFHEILLDISHIRIPNPYTILKILWFGLHLQVHAQIYLYLIEYIEQYGVFGKFESK